MNKKDFTLIEPNIWKHNTEQTTSYGYSVIENHIKAFFEATKKNTRADKISSSTLDQYYKYLRDIRSERLPKGIIFFIRKRT